MRTPAIIGRARDMYSGPYLWLEFVDWKGTGTIWYATIMEGGKDE